MDSVFEISGLHKSFDKKVIFTNFSMEVKRGELVCVTGPSGCGKSTLLNMMGMFELPDSGTIKLFGKPLPKLNSKAARKLLKDKILYLFQNYALIDDKSVAYNLSVPMFDKKYTATKKKEKQIEALSKVGLKVSLNSKIYQLSGGEQQRVSIARGFLRNFEVILADEPTGSLDTDNRDIVIQLLRSFADMGKAVVIVTHDPAVAVQADRVISLSKSN